MKLKTIILGIISVPIWYTSVLTQAYADLTILKHKPVFSQTSCTGTGYPIALCLSSENRLATIAISILNILLIFILLKYTSRLFSTKE